jgi:signal recognition particle GTPase
VFESLSDKLQSIFERLGSKGKLTENDVNVAMREVRLALLEADVNFKVVKEFVERVKAARDRRGGDGEPHARADGRQDRTRGIGRAAGQTGAAQHLGATAQP